MRLFPYLRGVVNKEDIFYPIPSLVDRQTVEWNINLETTEFEKYERIALLIEFSVNSIDYCIDFKDFVRQLIICDESDSTYFIEFPNILVKCSSLEIGTLVKENDGWSFSRCIVPFYNHLEWADYYFHEKNYINQMGGVSRLSDTHKCVFSWKTRKGYQKGMCDIFIHPIGNNSDSDDVRYYCHCNWNNGDIILDAYDECSSVWTIDFNKCYQNGYNRIIVMINLDHNGILEKGELANVCDLSLYIDNQKNSIFLPDKLLRSYTAEIFTFEYTEGGWNGLIIIYKTVLLKLHI